MTEIGYNKEAWKEAKYLQNLNFSRVEDSIFPSQKYFTICIGARQILQNPINQAYLPIWLQGIQTYFSCIITL